MVQKSPQKGAKQSPNGESLETKKPKMILARALMAIGLGGFWILVGHAAGQTGLGLACGLLGAAFIFAWTHPRRPPV